jgi:hypothetical protein
VVAAAADRRDRGRRQKTWCIFIYNATPTTPDQSIPLELRKTIICLNNNCYDEQIEKNDGTQKTRNALQPFKFLEMVIPLHQHDPPSEMIYKIEKKTMTPKRPDNALQPFKFLEMVIPLHQLQPFKFLEMVIPLHQHDPPSEMIYERL